VPSFFTTAMPSPVRKVLTLSSAMLLVLGLSSMRSSMATRARVVAKVGRK
jgi:hypothetical protein